MKRDYCEDCLRNLQGICEITGKPVEAAARVCKQAGWKEERPQRLDTERHTKSTGAWAEWLERR